MRNLTWLGKAETICQTALGSELITMELYRLDDIALLHPNTGVISYGVSTEVLVNDLMVNYVCPEADQFTQEQGLCN